MNPLPENNSLIISCQPFGCVKGKEVFLYTISHQSGASIQLTNYGATWISALIPDKNGDLSDVLLGYNDLKGYLCDTNYMGSTVGRFANRINNARFTLHDQIYELDKNDGENTNHGGFSGFNSRVFDAEVSGNSVVFSLVSPDGDGGFPGNITLKVKYSFTNDLKVLIQYWAITDQDTYLSLTNHSYFNLAGSGSVLTHELQISSAEILETDECFIPSGKMIQVQDTAFDFTRMRTIDSRMSEQNQQLIWNKGYNHCYPLDKFPESGLLQPAATLYDPLSGRQLQLFTTLPSVLIYTAGFLTSHLPGKSGNPHKPFEGICLEAQFYPDSPNQVHFPSCLLRKDEVYHHSIEYHFTCVAN